MTPLFEKDGFFICFEAEPEDLDMERHFRKECGWTKHEFNKIKYFDWFCAKVSAWKDGKEYGVVYLGGCCYEKAEEFYTIYKDDYFAQMVDEALEDAKLRLATEEKYQCKNVEIWK